MDLQRQPRRKSKQRLAPLRFWTPRILGMRGCEILPSCFNFCRSEMENVPAGLRMALPESACDFLVRVRFSLGGSTGSLEGGDGRFLEERKR